jgi:hypothetical protein
MSTGYGEFDTSCPENPDGHVWAQQDDNRPCVYCGIVARGPGGFLEQATGARTEFFSTLKAPKSAHGTPRKKA